MKWIQVFAIGLAASNAQSSQLCEATDSLSCDGRFELLGVMHGGLKVTGYELVFGSAQRSAKRLILEKGAEYIGMYSVPSLNIELEGECILFVDVPAEEGNRICIPGGMPSESVYLAGESSELFK